VKSFAFPSRNYKAAQAFLYTEQGKSLHMGIIRNSLQQDYRRFLPVIWMSLVQRYTWQPLLFDEVCEAVYSLNDAQKVFHEVELTSAPDLLEWTSHWCYSPDRAFCV
jgi:hypothetical protein